MDFIVCFGGFLPRFADGSCWFSSLEAFGCFVHSAACWETGRTGVLCLSQVDQIPPIKKFGPLRCEGVDEQIDHLLNAVAAATHRFAHQIRMRVFEGAWGCLEAPRYLADMLRVAIPDV